jgi:hypothetical protein
MSSSPQLKTGPAIATVRPSKANFVAPNQARSVVLAEPCMPIEVPMPPPIKGSKWTCTGALKDALTGSENEGPCS